jgi:hypothetical protein
MATATSTPSLTTQVASIQAALTALTALVTSLENSLVAVVTPSPTPAPAPTPAPTSISIAWWLPSAGSTVSGIMPISLTGSGMVNTEIWYNGASIGTMKVVGGTAATGTIDTTKLPNGSITLSAETWNVAPGQAAVTTLYAYATLTVIVNNAVAVTPSPAPAPVPTPTPAPTPTGTGRNALLGMYGSSGTTVSGWLGEKPDFTINNSFQDPGVSAGVSGLSGINGYPVVIALDLGAQHYNCTDTDYIAAAAGQYNAQFTSKVQSLLPYASSIYGIRIDPEFNLHGGGSSWATWYDRSDVGPTVYKAAFNALAKICKQYLPNAKVIWNPNIENGSDVMPYFPGTQYCDIVGIDLYMQPQWSTTFAHYNGLTTNGLSQFAALAKANNIPLMFCEWADMYSDASNLTAMAAWIKANNVVAHTYWNSNDALTVTSPNSSPVLVGAKQTAFAAAFGNAAYTGTYWSKKATTMAFNNY